MGETVESERDIVFLGAKSEDADSCKGYILRRLALGRAAMAGLTKLSKDKDITTTTQWRIVNAVVFQCCMVVNPEADWNEYH